jgi:5S rRNA maturation endonuclease (ribonuclease M5)
MSPLSSVPPWPTDSSAARRAVTQYLTEERRLPPNLVAAADILAEDRGGEPWLGFRYRTPAGVAQFTKYLALKRAGGKKRMKIEPVGRAPILFGLEQLRADADAVLITEGELDALSLRAVGLNAVSVPGGAGTAVTAELLAPLAAYDPVLIATDHDEPGDKLAVKLAAMLGAARCHRVYFGEHKDANAALVAGWAPAQFKEALGATASLAAVVNLEDVMPEQISWLWYGRIACGKVTLLDGDPGLGKSTLALEIAARVSRGEQLPEHLFQAVGPAGVVILSAEDGLADTICPRLRAARADLTRIRAITATADGGLPSLPTDIPAIEATALAVGAKLIIIDPLMAYLDAKVDSHKDQDVRRALAPLAAMAERTGAAILVVRHLNKNGGANNPLYRGGGSIGIIGAARSALFLAKDPMDDTGASRVVASTKRNVAKPPPSLRFVLKEVADGMTVIDWCGVSACTAETLMAPLPTEEERSSRRSAEEFLKAALKDGPRDSKDVAAEAKANGVTERTLKRARAALGIIPTKDQSKDGRWILALPLSTRVAKY